MKKSVTTALVLPTAIALALGGTALTASAAPAEPAPVEQVVDPGAPTGTEDASGPDGLGVRDAEATSTADEAEAPTSAETGSADEPEGRPADEPDAGAGSGPAAGAGAEDLATAAAAAAPAAPVVLSPVSEGTVEVGTRSTRGSVTRTRSAW